MKKYWMIGPAVLMLCGTVAGADWENLPEAAKGSGETCWLIIATPAQAVVLQEIVNLKAQVDVLDQKITNLGQPVKSVPKRRGTRKQVLGKVLVENHTGRAQCFAVNGFRYHITPGRTEIPVAVGTVTTHLYHHEIPVEWGKENWRWTGREYQLAVAINNSFPRLW